MFLTRELTPHSLPEIGRCFGGRDHTTILHALRAVARRGAKDDYTAAALTELREAIGALPAAPIEMRAAASVAAFCRRIPVPRKAVTPMERIRPPSPKRLAARPEPFVPLDRFLAALILERRRSRQEPA
jgi:hypothetical protein